MSAGRWSRNKSNRQSTSDGGAILASPMSPTSGNSCMFTERVCQRPVVDPDTNMCWAHSTKSRDIASSPIKSRSTKNMDLSAEPADREKLSKLTHKYLREDIALQTPQQHQQSSVADSSSQLQVHHLEAIGSINVDDPTAPFCQIEDSASDDGSDEFDSAAPLGRAGVYSAEEVVSLACDRMQQLRRLYIEELKQVGVQLKLSRRRYLTEVARDRRRRIGDPLCDYVAVTPEQQHARRMLAAMRRHRRQYPGADCVLRYNLRSRNKPQAPNTRDQVETVQLATTTVSTPKHCAISSCEDVALPLTKYCSKHILLDRRQLLFSKCPGLNVVVNSAITGDQKTKNIECGRLAVQGPTTLSRGLTSISNSKGTTTTSSPTPPASTSSMATQSFCSIHRVLSSVSDSLCSNDKPSNN